MNKCLLRVARFKFTGAFVGFLFAYLPFLVPLKKIYEDENFIAAAHPSPSYPGHTLIIPRKVARDMFRLTAGDFHGAVETAKKIRAGGGDFTLMINGGSRQDVMQAHFHLFACRAAERGVSDAPRSSERKGKDVTRVAECDGKDVTFAERDEPDACSRDAQSPMSISQYPFGGYKNFRGARTLQIPSETFWNGFDRGLRATIAEYGVPDSFSLVFRFGGTERIFICF